MDPDFFGGNGGAGGALFGREPKSGGAGAVFARGDVVGRVNLLPPRLGASVDVKRFAVDKIFGDYRGGFLAAGICCEPNGGANGDGRGVVGAHRRWVVIHRPISGKENKLEYRPKQIDNAGGLDAGICRDPGIFAVGIHDFCPVAGRSAAGKNFALVILNVGAGGGGVNRLFSGVQGGGFLAGAVAGAGGKFCRWLAHA